MKFRKKPVVIEAARTRDLIGLSKDDWQALPTWIQSAYGRGHIVFLPSAMLIKTPEGTMQANREDWIICGIQGEIYPCKPDIFEATYEPVGQS